MEKTTALLHSVPVSFPTTEMIRRDIEKSKDDAGKACLNLVEVLTDHAEQAHAIAGLGNLPQGVITALCLLKKDINTQCTQIQSLLTRSQSSPGR